MYDTRKAEMNPFSERRDPFSERRDLFSERFRKVQSLRFKVRGWDPKVIRNVIAKNQKLGLCEGVLKQSTLSYSFCQEIACLSTDRLLPPKGRDRNDD